MKNLIKKMPILFLFVFLLANNFTVNAQTANVSATDQTRVQIIAEELKSNPTGYFEQYFNQLKNTVGKEYEITSFTITVACKVGESKPGMRIAGKNVNEQAIELINTAQKGDIIILDGIKAKNEKGIKNLPPFLIYVQ